MRGEFIDVGGARLYCYAAGTRGAGEPVVFVHGFPTSSHLWRDVVECVPAGHRVVVLDLLGFGRSDRPAARDVTVRGHADRVLALFDLLGIERACVVGHDMGGGIAQSLAVRHPARVSHLCLIDSVAFDAWPVREVKLARAMMPLTRNLPPSWLLSAVKMDLLRGYVDQERGAHSLALYLRPFGTDEGYAGLMEHLAAMDSIETEAIAPRLGGIPQPTAIIWGERDPWLPIEIARRLKSTIDDATIHLLPGCSHFSPEEAPTQIGEVLTGLLAR